MKEKKFLDRKKRFQENIADIKEQIRNLPFKQQHSISDIEKQIAQIPINAAKERINLENEMKEDLLSVDISLANNLIQKGFERLDDDYLNPYLL